MVHRAVDWPPTASPTWRRVDDTSLAEYDAATGDRGGHPYGADAGIVHERESGRVGGFVGAAPNSQTNTS